MTKKKKKKEKKEKVKKLTSGNIIEGIQNVYFLYERYLEKTFHQFGLSNEQYRVLNILDSAPEEGYTLKHIRDLLPNQTSNATRLVDKLRSKKYLIKKTSRTDKRELRISLTDSGRQTLQMAQKSLSGFEIDLKKTIKSKNAVDFLETLNHITSAFNHP